MASRCITYSPGRNKLKAAHQNNRLSEYQHEEFPGSPSLDCPEILMQRVYCGPTALFID